MFPEPFKIRDERGAGDPFDDGVRIFQHVGVDLFEHDDIFRAAIEQDLRVLVNGQHGGDALESLQDGFEPLFISGFAIHLMRDVIVIRRDLHGDLSAGVEPREQLRNQLRMIITPLQGGIAEDQVPVAGEGGQISRLENQARPSERSGFLQHLRRRVQPGHIGVGKPVRQLTRQLAGAASQVNRFEIRAGIHKREQIVKRRRALGLKFMILIGIPRHKQFPSPCSR